MERTARAAGAGLADEKNRKSPLFILDIYL